MLKVMQEPIYRRALERAFQLVMHHKILWIFGVLSLLLGQLGWNNFIGSLALFSNDKIGFGSYFLNFPWGVVFDGKNIIWSVWLFVIIFVLSVGVILLSVASEGALIAAATGWFKGGKMLDVYAAWRKGVKHFKNLFILHIIKKTLLVVLLVIVNSFISNLFYSNSVTDSFILVMVVTLGVFLALLISCIGIYAAGYIVEVELPLLQSIKEGAVLFKEHVLVSLELSLILLGIQMSVILLFMAFSVWFLIPLFSFTLVAGFTGQLGLIMTGFVSSMALFFVIAALVGGLLNAFAVAAWMHLFMKMHHEGVSSRLLSLFTKFKQA